MRIRILAITLLLGATGWADVASTQPVARPDNFVTRAEWGSTPDPIPDSRKQVPQWVTIHHAGVLWTNRVDPAIFVKNMQAWGKKRPQLEKPPRDTFWPDLPYHFLIAPNGKIYEGRLVEYEPESNTKYSVNGNIGIEMMGDFEKQRPSASQLQSCAHLTAWLCQEYKVNLDHIRGHKDAAQGQTTCPGKDFYRYIESGQFRGWVQEYMKGNTPKIEAGPALADGPTILITETKAPTTAPTTKSVK